MCASNFIATDWTRPFSILTWPCLCVWIKEKLWFSQRGRTWLLIPAERLWCDFKCRPWAKNVSPNTNDLYNHYMDKSTGTTTSLEEKKALPNCGNKDRNIINVFKNCISTCVATELKCMKWLYPICTHMSLVFGTIVYYFWQYSVLKTVIMWNNIELLFYLK